MEFITAYTLLGSSLSFIICLVIYLIALGISDLEESGSFSTAITTIFIGILYFFSDHKVFEIFTLHNILFYLFIGILFAVIRTYFKGKELSKEQKTRFDLRSNFIRWWLLFPICAINWVIGKLLIDISMFIYSKIEKIIIKIFNA